MVGFCVAGRYRRALDAVTQCSGHRYGTEPDQQHTAMSSHGRKHRPPLQDRIHRRDAAGHADHRHSSWGGRADFPGRGQRCKQRGGQPTPRGLKIPILIVHQGGFQNPSSALNGCAGNLAGSDIEKIAQRLDPSIKIIVSAHTHAEYRCTITTNGIIRLVTSTSSFGRVLSDITLTVSDLTGELVSADVTNTIVEKCA
jgi:hypothetical protein